MIGTTQLINTFSGITPSDHFKTKLYTGNGSTQSITGLAFAPDMVWIKARSVGYTHSLQDTLRGPGTSTSLYPDLTSTEGTYGGYGQISAFGTEGFTVASGGHGTYPVAQVNQNGVTYASWNWKAGDTTVTNNEGTVTSQVSANTAAGFSIVTYTGNSTAGATIGHGLNATPELVVVKLRSGISAKAWTVYAEPLGNTNYFYLNENYLSQTYNFWNNTSPTSAVFSLSSDTNVNSSSGQYVAYCWRSVPGFSKIGTYNGNTNSTNTINVGFAPSFLMIKRINSSGNWRMYDRARDSGNLPQRIDYNLAANLAGQEYNATSGSTGYAWFSSTGFYFETNQTNSDINTNGGTYVYMAIA